MNQIECDKSSQLMLWEMSYEGTEECKHSLPGDWQFGGATEEDPRTDPRWQPVTYTYLDRNLRSLTITQVPRCDHEAMGSHRELIDSRNPGRHTHYIMAAYPGAPKAEPIYTAGLDGGK